MFLLNQFLLHKLKFCTLCLVLSCVTNSFATSTNTSSSFSASKKHTSTHYGKSNLVALPSTESTKPTESLSDQYPDINFNYFNTFIPYVYQSIKDYQTKTRLLAPFPQSSESLIDTTSPNDPIVITADRIISSNHGNTITYTGNVKISQGKRVLTAKEVIYNALPNGEQTILVDGKLYIKNPKFRITSQNTTIDLKNSKVELKQLDFYLVNSFLHGESAKLVLENGKTVTVDNLYLYSGLKSPTSLNLNSKQAQIDSEEQKIKLNSVTYRIGNIPVFWLPSQTINIGAEKIFPGLQKIQHKFGDLSKIQLAVPYLVKFTPNLSWLFTTRFFLSIDTNNFENNLDFENGPFFHHFVFENRLNWNNRLGLTTANINFAPKFTNKHYTYNGYYVSLSHDGWKNNFNYGFNANYINNENYFKDFYFSESQYLTDNFYVRNSGYTHDFSFIGLYYQPINGYDHYTYSIYPEVTYSHYDPFAYDQLIYNTTNQYAFFASPSFAYSHAHRLYSENNLSYSTLNPYYTIAYSFNTTTAAYSQYNQYTKRYVDVFKFTPEFTVKLASKFKFDHLWLDHYLANFELSFNYRYRHNYGYNIQNTGIYDSGILPVSYFALSDGIYTYGIDRLYDINQINLGLKFHAYDVNSGLNKLSGSFHYVQAIDWNNYLDLNAEPTEFLKLLTRPSKDLFQLANNKDLLAKLHWNYNPEFNLDGSVIVDLEHKNSYMGIYSLNYQPNQTNILQLSYRYASYEYLRHKIQGYTSNEDINQVGLSTIWDLSPSIAIMNSNYFDVNTFKPVDTTIAVNYTGYGWYVGIMIERSRNGKNSYQNGIYFQAGTIGFDDDYNNHFSTFINYGAIPFVGNK